MLRQACSAGYTVYHGAREGVLSFFSNLGFQMPPRKGIAEYLEELVSPKDQAVSFWCSAVTGVAQCNFSGCGSLALWLELG